MEHPLFQQIAARISDWQRAGFKHDEYPVLAEILAWASAPDGSGWQLRPPQLRALEVYWYLRLVEKTPRIFDLYQRYFPPADKGALLKALGIPDEAFNSVNFELKTLWQKIQSDDSFVRQFRLEALRETLALDYPSYILALAMGAGKTALIGAIIATEFAMALEYPDGPFVQNALVFAPGTTILAALRDLADVPYQRILPARLYKAFAASVKIIFTRDGEKDIPVIRGSCFNVVVTNTEKIRIRRKRFESPTSARCLISRAKIKPAPKSQIFVCKPSPACRISACFRTRRITPTDRRSTPNSRKSARPWTTCTRKARIWSAW